MTPCCTINTNTTININTTITISFQTTGQVYPVKGGNGWNILYFDKGDEDARFSRDRILEPSEAAFEDRLLWDIDVH